MLLAGLMLSWVSLTAMTAYAWGNPLRLAEDLAARAPTARESGRPIAYPAMRARLSWRYGPERAASILAGQDAATKADIAAWKNIGNRSAI